MSTPLDHARWLFATLHPHPSATALVQVTGLMKKHKPVNEYYFDTTIAAERALELNAERYSVFIGVNPRKQMSSFEVDVTATTALFLDLQPERTQIADVVAMLTNFGIPPSIQVWSGNGAHLYLLVHATDPTIAKPIAQRLCKATFADATFNQNRIARVPGSVNWKPPPKQPTWCFLVEGHPERRYDIMQIDAALDAMGAPHPRQAKDTAPHEAVDPPEDWPELRKRLSEHALTIIDYGEKNPYSEKQVSRSEADWLVVCSLVRADASDDMIFWVYQSQPIRVLKYAEAGDRYLHRTIEAARRAVGASREPREIREAQEEQETAVQGRSGAGPHKGVYRDSCYTSTEASLGRRRNHK